MFTKIAKLYPIIFLALLGANSASAACTAPNLSNSTDIVLQLNGDSVDGAFVGTAGARAAGARAEGAIYYDRSSKSLVFCNGTDWVTAAGSGAATASEPLPPLSAKSYPEYLNGSITGTQYVGVDIPAGDIGQGVFNFEIHFYPLSDGQICHLYQRKADGSNQLVHTSRRGYPDYAIIATKIMVSETQSGQTWSENGGYAYEFNKATYSSLSDPFTGKFQVVAEGSSQCYLRLYSVSRDART